jgi:diguanylate cyclase (GGDEF)-like protein/PAS domain S-box-containing protein
MSEARKHIQIPYEALQGGLAPALSFTENRRIVWSAADDEALNDLVDDGFLKEDVFKHFQIVFQSKSVVMDTFTFVVHNEAPREGHAIDEGRSYDFCALYADGHCIVFFKNTTVASTLRTALVESRGRYRDLVEISADFVWETNAEGCFTFVSRQGFLGFRQDDLIGMAANTLVDPDKNGEIVSPFETANRLLDKGVWLRGAQAEGRYFQFSAAPLYTHDGQWRGARGVCRDITSQYRRELQLAKTRHAERVQARISQIFMQTIEIEKSLDFAAEALAQGGAADGCLIMRFIPPEHKATDDWVPVTCSYYGDVGDDKEIARVVEPFVRTTGFDHIEEVSEGRWDVLLVGCGYQGRMNGLVMLWRDSKQHKLVWEQEDRWLVTTVSSQISVALEQLRYRNVLKEQARTDPLTGFLNRASFMEEVERRIRRLRGQAESLGSVLFIDMDNFKSVNDTYGHDVGDKAILQLRDILYRNTRPTDLLGRIGGDEFVVWLEGASAENAAKRGKLFIQAATVLRKFSASPDKLLTISVGVSECSNVKSADSEKIEDLIKRADMAMYRAKKSGKGCVMIDQNHSSDNAIVS